MQRYFVRNPGGRIAEVNDEEEVQKWLAQGFTLPTEDEIARHLAQMDEEYTRLQASIEREKTSKGADGVYFATVSIGGKDGYGVSGAKLLTHLQDLGVKASTSFTGQKVALLYHAPYSLAHLTSPIRIIYTMFESTKIPDEWHQYLSLADKILVPSKYCQAVFKNAGFDSEVVPLGYDEKLFVPLNRTTAESSNRPFTFIHYDAFNVRKGFMELFKAFVNEFKPTEPVKLILKTTRQPAPLAIPPSVYPNIEVITGPMQDSELVGLLARSDCFVFPSRGEGFGMTPLEAMGTGLPVIVPNAHGISEYFNPAFMYEVKVAGETPATYSAYKGQDVGKMVITDVADLQRQMRYVYEHQDEALNKGLAAAYYVQRYSYKETSRALKEILDEAALMPAKEYKEDKVLPMLKV